MALVTQFTAGHTINDILAYTTSGPAGFSIAQDVATPWGGVHMKAVGNVSAALNATTVTDSPANDTAVWRMGFFWFTNIGSGNFVTIYTLSVAGDTESTMALRILEDGSGNFNIVLLGSPTGTLGTGATNLATETWHMVVWRFDGTDTKVWVGGTLEITAAGFADKPDDTDLTAGGTSGGVPAEIRRWAHWGGMTSDAAGDITETTVYTEVRAKLIDGEDNGTHNQWGDDGDVQSQDGQDSDWDDWRDGQADDATAYIAGKNLNMTVSGVSIPGGSPTVITVDTTTNLLTGDSVTLAGLDTTPQINGEWVVTVIDGTTFSIPENVTATVDVDGTAVILLRQSAAMTDPGDFSNTIQSVVHIARQRASAAGKNTNVSALLHLSGTDAESSVVDEPSDVFTPRNKLFEQAPGAVAWTQARWDAIEGGIRRDGGTDGAGVHVTAMGLEGLAIGANAPLVVAAHMSRPGVAMGSANVMIQ